MPVLDFDRTIETGVTLEGDPYRGDATAPVVIELYEDLACPHCRDFFANTEPLLEENYLKSAKVKVVSHTLAIVNQNSIPAAEAAACAADQGHFWEMRQLLFANQSDGVSRERVVEYGEIIGLDSSALTQCFDSQEHRSEIEQRNANASRLGIRGTPTLVIAGQRYEGAIPFLSTQPNVPGLQDLIEEQLAGS